MVSMDTRRVPLELVRKRGANLVEWQDRFRDFVYGYMQQKAEVKKNHPPNLLYFVDKFLFRGQINTTQGARGGHLMPDGILGAELKKKGKVIPMLPTDLTEIVLIAWILQTGYDHKTDKTKGAEMTVIKAGFISTRLRLWCLHA